MWADPQSIFDLPSLSPPCKQSRENLTNAEGWGDLQTLALAKDTMNKKFLFCLNSLKSGCKFHRSHFGSRYKLGCCGHAGLFAAWFDSCWTPLAHCTWYVQGTVCVIFNAFLLLLQELNFEFPGRRSTSKQLGLMLTSWVNK